MIQLQCINYILDSKDASFIIMNNLTDEFFSEHKDEFNFIRSHFDRYGVIPDKVTFASKFQKFNFINVTETPEFLIKALYDDRNRRIFAPEFNHIRELAIQNKMDEVMACLAAVQSRMVEASQSSSLDIIQNTSRYQLYLDRTSNFNSFYVTTGFKELDDVIGGWDRKEELATIVARPGVGKSWVLLKTALAAAKAGLNVGFYSGEMSTDLVGYRLDTLASGISNGAIIHGDISVRDTYKAAIDKLQQSIKGSLKIITPNMINGPAGVTALRAFIEKEHLDMLCIDQHSLLEDDKKAKNPVEKAANISKDLKNLQVMKRIPIVAVSQQNRTSVEEGVGTQHVAQSDRISQDSTTIIFLEQKDGILTLDLVKSRNSSAGAKLKYQVNLNKGSFNYLPTDEDPTNGADCKELLDEYVIDEEGAPF